MSEAHVSEVSVPGAAASSQPSTAASHLRKAGPWAASIGTIVAIVGATSIVTNPPAEQAPATPAELPATAGPTDPSGGPAMPAVQFDQQAPGLPQGLQRNVEILVKFKDDGKVNDIIDAFWRDQPSARTRFDAWKANRPEFARLNLDRVTYSNELVLVMDTSGPPAERAAVLRDLMKVLAAAPDISYAEQQTVMAQPGVK